MNGCYDGAVAEEHEGGPRGTSAAEADRDAAIQRLIKACLQGRLTLGEFGERIEAVLAATTAADLGRATGDLLPLSVEARPADAARLRRWSISIVGGLHRRGPWRLPKHMIHVSLIGGASIDFSNAEVFNAETTFTLVSLIGGADLRVPRAVRCELSGFTLLGGRRVTGPPSAPVDGPLLHFRVFSLVGGASLKLT